jgi:deazaflavin-dependent oxidoreductase (nitroreductase family)
MAHPLRWSLVRIARIPVAADRRGLRWLLNGKVMPGGPIALITFRGRHTGKTYRTPVEVLVEDQDEIVVTPVRGARSGWYRSIVAGGLVSVRFRGATYAADWRELSEDERKVSLGRYLTEHPVFGRMILSGMARGHARSGDRVADAAGSATLLALKLR